MSERAAAVLVPAAPLLLGAVTGPGAGDLGGLRQAVSAATTALARGASEAGTATVGVLSRRAAGSLAGFGAPVAAPVGDDAAPWWRHELGVLLLRAAGWRGAVRHHVPDGWPRAVAGERAGAPGWEPLLVLAEGSAARGPRAPLPDDPRGEEVDAALAAALTAGDPALLPGSAAAGAVGCADVPLVAAFLAATPGRPPALTWAGAPCGVGYLVAVAAAVHP